MKILKKNKVVFTAEHDSIGCFSMMIIGPLGLGIILGAIELSKHINFQQPLTLLAFLCGTFLTLFVFAWIASIIIDKISERINPSILDLTDISKDKITYSFETQWWLRGNPQHVRIYFANLDKTFHFHPNTFDDLKTFLEKEGIKLKKI